MSDIKYKPTATYINMNDNIDMVLFKLMALCKVSYTKSCAFQISDQTLKDKNNNLNDYLNAIFPIKTIKA